MTSPLQQKIKITGPSVVTANRAWDGMVICRNARHGWSTELATPPSFTLRTRRATLLADSAADDVGAIGAVYRAGGGER